jgi:hypothetical protein
METTIVAMSSGFIVSTVDTMPSLLVSRSIEVNAPASEIFNLLADPSRHHEIDGSGTVVAAASSQPDRLSLGSTFGMKMRLGMPYRITNTVVEFAEGRTIAWRHLGGHVWRYQLEPASNPNHTVVTETFDGTVAKFPPGLLLAGYPKRNAASIEATLKRLADKFSSNG